MKGQGVGWANRPGEGPGVEQELEGLPRQREPREDGPRAPTVEVAELSFRE